MKRKCPWKDVYTEEVIREKIIENHDEGMEIEEIASMAGYHNKSVAKIIRNWSNSRTFQRTKGAGRPQSLIRADKVAITNCLRSKPWLSSVKIKEHLQLQVSSRTITRFLKEKGYVYQKPARKPKLKNNDKQNRLEWALMNKNMDFSNVVFADECSIWMREWSGKMWLKKGEEHYIGTEAHPKKVHIWGAIGLEGIISICVFEGNLNSSKLVAILKDSLIDEANSLYGKGQWILAHDNDPKHKAKKTQEFLNQEQVAFF